MDRRAFPSRRPASGLAALVASGTLLAMPPSAAAQDRCETYDACALRVESGFFGGRLLRGSEAGRVASIGLFPPTIEPFETAGDSVRVNFDAFRSRKTTGGILQIAMMTASAVGLILTIDDSDGNETGIAIASGVSFGFGVAAGAVDRSAFNHLSRAVWWYNRELEPAGGNPGSRSGG